MNNQNQTNTQPQSYKPIKMISIKLYSTVVYDFALAVTLEFHTMRKKLSTVYVNPVSCFGNIDVTPFMKFVYAKFNRDQSGHILSKLEYTFFVPVTSIYKLKYGFKKIMGTLESPNAYRIGNDKSEPAGTPAHLIITQEAYDYSLTKILNLNNRVQNDVNSLVMTATWMTSSNGTYSKAFCLGIYGNSIPHDGYVMYMTKDEFEPLFMAIDEVNVSAESTMAGMCVLENAYFHGSSNSVLEKADDQPQEQTSSFIPAAQPDPMGFEIPSFAEQTQQRAEKKKVESLAPRNDDPNYVSKALPNIDLGTPKEEPKTVAPTPAPIQPQLAAETKSVLPSPQIAEPQPTTSATQQPAAPAEPQQAEGTYHDGIGDDGSVGSEQIDEAISDGDMFAQ